MKYQYRIVYPNKTVTTFDVGDEVDMDGIRKIFTETTGVLWNDSNAAEVVAQKYKCEYIGPIAE